MAYGRIYIDNLRKKVTALFDILKAENRLNETCFIEKFKSKYPKDYAALVYEWEFKIHEFKKNRKGIPKPHPLRPEKILSNMYRNYYFKIVKRPIIAKHKEEEFTKLRCKIGELGYRIKKNDDGRFNIYNKKTKCIEQQNVDFKTLKKFVNQMSMGEHNDNRKHKHA